MEVKIQYKNRKKETIGECKALEDTLLIQRHFGKLSIQKLSTSEF